MKKILVFILLPLITEAQISKVISHAKWQTTQKVKYDGKYYKIPYPNGDVPANIGVCTDVIIRAYRSIGKDLQKLVHEDMLNNKAEYDKRRFYKKEADSNIDHRRTFNLRTYFTRQGFKKPITDKESDYLPGDIVFWDIAAGHVGIVVDIKVPGTTRYYVVHNICCGPQMEDFLFNAKIIDHYRWNP
jgi:uncharacterized protein YijF (DUF1287 family)